MFAAGKTGEEKGNIRLMISYMNCIVVNEQKSNMSSYLQFLANPTCSLCIVCKPCALFGSETLSHIPMGVIN